MRELVETVRRELAEGPVTNLKKIERLKNLVAATLPLLTKSSICKTPPKPGRYLCYKDPDFGFVVMIMVWDVGDRTPIHDHGTWGVEAMLLGKLGITTYTEDEDRPRRITKIHAAAGEIIYNLPPKRDVHQVENDGDELAVSLHVYGADMSKNRSFIPGKGFQPCDLKTCYLQTDFGLDDLMGPCLKEVRRFAAS